MDVAVIGAGPAGLMAALTASESKDVSVTVFEKNDMPGRKLLMTGGGRCNITHIARAQEWLDSYFENGKFLYSAFSEWSPSMINDFFRSCGIPIITEKDGRCFPEKGKAKAILSALIERCEKNGVQFEYGQKLTQIKSDQNGFIQSVHFSDKERFCRTCILSVGGMSYPSTGSSGDGYDIARALGHRIITPRPGLAPIRVSEAQVEGLAGFSCKSVGISVFVEGKKSAQTVGDLLYTHEGLSGPGIMRISRALPEERVIKEDNVCVRVDFFPSIPEDGLQESMKSIIKGMPKRSVYNVLKELSRHLPAAHILKEAGIDTNLPCAMLQKKQIQALVSVLKSMSYRVTDSAHFDQAMVTAGGIDLKQIDPKTMASRCVPGLYFAGEIMNIDGDTGGYNLQAAFSTGCVAGRSAVKWIKEGMS